MLALSWASYSGNDSHKLLLWDDEPYITENNWVTNPSLDSVRSLFTEPRVGNWHPLTWLSYIPEYYFCETNANCYKNTNIVLHGANSFLVFLLSGLVLSLLLREGDRSSFKLGDLTDRRVFIASLMVISGFTVISFISSVPTTTQNLPHFQTLNYFHEIVPKLE